MMSGSNNDCGAVAGRGLTRRAEVGRSRFSENFLGVASDVVGTTTKFRKSSSDAILNREEFFMRPRLT